MSDSVRPHRRQPTRLPLPSDSPGKNTGVGCHFLLQCTKVKIESEVAQSCWTLSDPMDWSLPGSSIHGIFQAKEYWSGVPKGKQTKNSRVLLDFLSSQNLMSMGFSKDKDIFINGSWTWSDHRRTNSTFYSLAFHMFCCLSPPVISEGQHSISVFFPLSFRTWHEKEWILNEGNVHPMCMFFHPF